MLESNLFGVGVCAGFMIGFGIGWLILLWPSKRETIDEYDTEL